MNNPFIHNEVRFTIIDPGCIRIEYSPKGIFRDAPTLFAANRDVLSSDFTVENKDNRLRIRTSLLELNWEYKWRCPKNGTLNIKLNGSDKKWCYGKKNKGDLGGVLQSLDGCSAPMALPEGFLSREGWSVIDDTKAAILKEGWIEADPHEEEYVDLYFFAYGSDYKRALKLLMNLSGKVPMIPRWSMGSWYSRWYQYTSEDYRGILKEYEDNGFPLDVIVMDMEWHTRGGDRGWGWAGTLGWTGWTWNRELLPDAEKLLTEFHDRGLQIAMNVHPHDGIRSHEECYGPFMDAMGESKENGNALDFDAGNRKYMENYFRYAHAPHEKDGCSVWWVDWQQDCIYPWVKGVKGTKHVPWLNTCYYNHMKSGGRRGIAFSRWGGFGDQKHPIHFSGDTTSTWEVLAFQIAFTSISGNSGCFFWTHDMGGFCGKRNEELYARWLQFGAVSAVMRLHSAGDDVDRRPWKWSEPFRSSMKKSFELRSRLMPYLYTAMHDACRDSVPMLKALYIEHPEDPSAYENMQSFYVGNDLLAAPVTAPGSGEQYTAFQKLYVPDGEWFQFFTGEHFTKGMYPVATSLDEMPLFVRAGVAVPLGKPDKKRLADLDDAFDLMVFPASEPGERIFTLYEDDGTTDAYERGEYAETVIRCRSAQNHITVTVEPVKGHFAGMPGTRSFALNLRNVKQVSALRVNGKETAFQPDEKRSSIISSSVPAGTGTIVFEADFEPADQKKIRNDAADARMSPGMPPEQALLLTGIGVLPYLEPLTGKKSLFVWPEGLTFFSCGQGGTAFHGCVQSKGSDPIRIPLSGTMDFGYGETRFHVEQKTAE